MTDPYTPGLGTGGGTSTDRINGVVASLAIKAPVRTAITTPISLYGEQTINGLALVTGDRALVMGQANTVENGVYNVSSTNWKRAADFDGNRDAIHGTMVLVTDADTPAAAPLPASEPYYAKTAAEIAAGLDYGTVAGTISQTQYEPGDVRRYGATTVVTNNTAAIQASINQCSHAGARVYIPKGRWNYTGTLYYSFRTGLNENFATDQVPEGDLLIVGDGPTDYAFEFNSTPDQKADKGSVLDYTGAGNAHEVFTDGALESVHCVKFRDLSLVGTTVGVIWLADNVSRNVGLENCFVGNWDTGAGQCIVWKNNFYTLVRDCFVTCKSTTSEMAVFANEAAGSGGGGHWELTGTTFRGGATACRVGSTNAAIAAVMENPIIIGCQFKTSDNGLIIGTGVKRGIVAGNYFEDNNNRNLWIYNGPGPLDVVGNHFGDLNLGAEIANIELGLRGGDITECAFQGVTLRGNGGDADVAPFLRRTIWGPGNGRNQTTVDTNDFSGEGTVRVDNEGAGGLIYINNRHGDSSKVGSTDAELVGVIENAALFISGSEDTEGQTAVHGVYETPAGLITYAGAPQAVTMNYHKYRLRGITGAYQLNIGDGLYDGQEVTFTQISGTQTVTLDFTGTTAEFVATIALAQDDSATIWWENSGAGGFSGWMIKSTYGSPVVT